MTAMTLKEEAESYLGLRISREEFSAAAARAKRKLAFIIERFGDANGERREQYYLAQLISEAVRENRLSEYTMALYDLRLQTEIKKEMPVAGATGQI